MIFISYNHNDKPLVDTIARRLEIEFGRNNIFYDSWSIQPGESIIYQMNKGLENYTTFFFMLSTNSLKSKMVEKEWQAALIRQLSDKEIKFIPVRIDDCKPPAILSDQLYIDLYGEGLDSAVTKMRNVIKNKNSYNPNEDINNLEVSISNPSANAIKIVISANYYAEHNPRFGIGIIGISHMDLTFGDTSEAMSGSSDGNIKMNGKVVDIKIISLMRTLNKYEPFYVVISSNKPFNIEDLLTLHIKGSTVEYIPIKYDTL